METLLNALRTSYRYEAWANRRVFDAAAGLSWEEFQAVRGAQPSLLVTLLHLLSAQRYWLARAQLVAPPDDLQPSEIANFAALLATRDAIETQVLAFLDGLDAADVDRHIAYVDEAGDRWVYPLWQLLVHLANHGMQHRSEAAVLLTDLGRSPGWLDFLIFIDETNAARS